MAMSAPRRGTSTSLSSHPEHVLDPGDNIFDPTVDDSTSTSTSQTEATDTTTPAPPKSTQSPRSAESTYNWSADQDALVLAHNAIRKEIHDMKLVFQQFVVRAAALQQASETTHLPMLLAWEVGSIQQWFQGHEIHVRYHCQNENDHLLPILMKQLEDFGVDQIQHDHERLNQGLNELETRVSKLTASSPSSDSIKQELEDLYQAWCKYEKIAVDHFDHEERHYIARIRQAFPSLQWGTIMKAFFDIGAREEFGSLIHAMGGEEGFRKGYMAPRSIPDIFWQVSFEKKLRYYESTMLRHLQALQQGTPPPCTTANDSEGDLLDNE